MPLTYNPTYKNGKPITDFASINRRTSLKSLNLNWRERDLPERERTKHVHRLHPYLGKFIPQLVEIFLRKYRPKVVYDPFCGSGTTLVEANVLGIESIGCDISAFNCLLSKVKTDKYDLDILEKENVQVYVVNIHTIKPVDEKLIVDLAKKTNCVITAEDHNIIGGLGGAVAEVLSENYPCIMKRIGLQDRYAESGKPEELYRKYGLDAESIAEEVMKFVKKK